MDPTHPSTGAAHTPTSVSPDGARFLRIQRVEPERAIRQCELVLNWFATLGQRGSGDGE